MVSVVLLLKMAVPKHQRVSRLIQRDLVHSMTFTPNVC